MTTNKKQMLRNNEYYGLQDTFDYLYAASKGDKQFKNLMELIMSDENILLAYRNIKANKGSKTAGVNKHSIYHINKMAKEDMLTYFKSRLNNFQPHKVKRVMIPKADGGSRPLGIPSIEDRIVQQCIKQVLEPICEAKFHSHSYGFRPNRDTEHAIARLSALVNKTKLHYVVEVDIKGFFDNVNHGKLLKQLWTMGVHDKALLKVISKILKSDVEGLGVQSKGTPQGGILSPLLSNVVLNELDWWVSSQWESFKTDKDYSRHRDGRIDQSHKYRALKLTNMKEMYIVRYADDFKIVCRYRRQADNVMKAVTMWLKERLHLDINEQKSSVVNLKRRNTNFLGISLKVREKQGKHVIKSTMTNKAKKVVTQELRCRVKKLQKQCSPYNVQMLNAHILGVHGYYKMATHVSKDFAEISYIINRVIDNRLIKRMSNAKVNSGTLDKFYKGYKGKQRTLSGITIYPISYIQHSYVKNFTQSICNYTNVGRSFIHDKLKVINPLILKHLATAYDTNNSIQYNDNKIALYCGQNGKCGVTKLPLELGDMYIHHKKPKELGGSDEYKNLIYVTGKIHSLIHATVDSTINKLKILISNEELVKINKLRKLVGNCEI